MLGFALRNWRLIASVLSIVALLGGAGLWIEKMKADAYADGYSDASAKCEAEKRAMEEANRKAISDAEKKLIEAEREITEKETELDDLHKALDLAADAEPDRDLVCLPHSSVRRLSTF